MVANSRYFGWVAFVLAAASLALFGFDGGATETLDDGLAYSYVGGDPPPMTDWIDDTYCAPSLTCYGDDCSDFNKSRCDGSDLGLYSLYLPIQGGDVNWGQCVEDTLESNKCKQSQNASDCAVKWSCAWSTPPDADPEDGHCAMEARTEDDPFQGTFCHSQNP